MSLVHSRNRLGQEHLLADHRKAWRSSPPNSLLPSALGTLVATPACGRIPGGSTRSFRRIWPRAQESAVGVDPGRNIRPPARMSPTKVTRPRLAQGVSPCVEPAPQPQSQARRCTRVSFSGPSSHAESRTQPTTRCCAIWLTRPKWHLPCGKTPFRRRRVETGLRILGSGRMHRAAGWLSGRGSTTPARLLSLARRFQVQGAAGIEHMRCQI